MKSEGSVSFQQAMELYTDLEGSLHAHRIELGELSKSGSQEQVNHLQQHIADGEKMLGELKTLTLQ